MAHIGSWEIDMIDQKLMWSDEMYRILGFAKNEMAADSAIFMSMVHPDDADRISHSFYGDICQSQLCLKYIPPQHKRWPYYTDL